MDEWMSLKVYTRQRKRGTFKVFLFVSIHSSMVDAMQEGLTKLNK